MTQAQSCKGFVLKRKLLLEKDISLTLFTEEFGKLTVLAKGVRKITSRRSAHLQSGNYVDLRLNKYNGMYYVQSSSLISGFMDLRIDDFIDVIYLVLHTLNSLLPEEVPEPVIFKEVKLFFIKLGKGDNKKKVLTKTLSKMLHILGYTDRENTLPKLLSIIEEHSDRKLPRHVIM